MLAFRNLNHRPTAESVESDGSYLSLDQEQFVASHHTQLAMVTGLCHEEMVLLKQINNGQKVRWFCILVGLLVL